jgi:antirestriction protein ArdC
MTNRPYSGCNVVLLWMARAAGYRAPRFLTYKQALELGGHVRKGERGTKVYFVKQLQVRDKDSVDGSATRLVPMLREYTVFNVDQCENLPARIITLSNTKPRNRDERMRLSTNSYHAAAPIFAKDLGKPIIGPAMTSSACRGSPILRPPRISTERPSMS